MIIPTPHRQRQSSPLQPASQWLPRHLLWRRNEQGKSTRKNTVTLIVFLGIFVVLSIACMIYKITHKVRRVVGPPKVPRERRYARRILARISYEPLAETFAAGNDAVKDTKGDDKDSEERTSSSIEVRGLNHECPICLIDVALPPDIDSSSHPQTHIQSNTTTTTTTPTSPPPSPHRRRRRRRHHILLNVLTKLNITPTRLRRQNPTPSNDSEKPKDAEVAASDTDQEDESLEKGYFTLRACHHSFHVACLVSWYLMGRRSCPICRRGFGKREQMENEVAAAGTNDGAVITAPEPVVVTSRSI